jgi:hypothetical protein
MAVLTAWPLVKLRSPDKKTSLANTGRLAKLLEGKNGMIDE